MDVYVCKYVDVYVCKYVDVDVLRYYVSISLPKLL